VSSHTGLQYCSQQLNRLLYQVSTFFQIEGTVSVLWVDPHYFNADLDPVPYPELEHFIAEKIQFFSNKKLKFCYPWACRRSLQLPKENILALQNEKNFFTVKFFVCLWVVCSLMDAVGIRIQATKISADSDPDPQNWKVP
jgi:hypothetical protein